MLSPGRERVRNSEASEPQETVRSGVFSALKAQKGSLFRPRGRPSLGKASHCWPTPRRSSWAPGRLRVVCPPARPPRASGSACGAQNHHHAVCSEPASRTPREWGQWRIERLRREPPSGGTQTWLGAPPPRTPRWSSSSCGGNSSGLFPRLMNTWGRTSHMCRCDAGRPLILTAGPCSALGACHPPGGGLGVFAASPPLLGFGRSPRRRGGQLCRKGAGRASAPENGSPDPGPG